MAKRGNTTGEKVRGYREVFGDYGAIRSFTGISPQRLASIAHGSAPTRSEASRIAAFGQRLEAGNASYSLQAAASKRGVSVNQIGQQLQSIASGTFRPEIRITLGQIAKTLNVEPQAVYHLSQDPITTRWGKEVRDPRGIKEGWIDRSGKIIGFGSDGEKYVAYVVKSKTTNTRRFFWARFESIGYLTAAEFQGMYEDDAADFSLDIADAWDGY